MVVLDMYICVCFYRISIISKIVLFLSCFADYGVDKYDIGTGFGHFAIATEDVSINYLAVSQYFSFSCMHHLHALKENYDKTVGL